MGYGNRSTGEPVSSSLFGRSASQRYEDGRSASGNFDQGQAGDQSQDEQMANGDKVVPAAGGEAGKQCNGPHNMQRMMALEGPLSSTASSDVDFGGRQQARRHPGERM
jgi:hypothetical protein